MYHVYDEPMSVQNYTIIMIIMLTSNQIEYTINYTSTDIQCNQIALINTTCIHSFKYAVHAALRVDLHDMWCNTNFPTANTRNWMSNW